MYARDIDGNYAKDIVVASAPTHIVSWFKELCATSVPNGGSGSTLPLTGMGVTLRADSKLFSSWS